MRKENWVKEDVPILQGLGHEIEVMEDGQHPDRPPNQLSGALTGEIRQQRIRNGLMGICRKCRGEWLQGLGAGRKGWKEKQRKKYQPCAQYEWSKPISQWKPTRDEWMQTAVQTPESHGKLCEFWVVGEEEAAARKGAMEGWLELVDPDTIAEEQRSWECPWCHRQLHNQVTPEGRKRSIRAHLRPRTERERQQACQRGGKGKTDKETTEMEQRVKRGEAPTYNQQKLAAQQASKMRRAIAKSVPVGKRNGHKIVPLSEGMHPDRPVTTCIFLTPGVYKGREQAPTQVCGICKKCRQEVTTGTQYQAGQGWVAETCRPYKWKKDEPDSWRPKLSVWRRIADQRTTAIEDMKKFYKMTKEEVEVREADWKWKKQKKKTKAEKKAAESLREKVQKILPLAQEGQGGATQKEKDKARWTSLAKGQVKKKPAIKIIGKKWQGMMKRPASPQQE